MSGRCRKHHQRNPDAEGGNPLMTKEIDWYTSRVKGKSAKPGNFTKRLEREYVEECGN
jgi:hypothetical protein